MYDGHGGINSEELGVIKVKGQRLKVILLVPLSPNLPIPQSPHPLVSPSLHPPISPSPNLPIPQSPLTSAVKLQSQ